MKAKYGVNRGGWARRGFTLLELIVVITIIGILGTLVVVRVAGLTEKAKQTKIKSDLQAIIRAVELYQASTGRIPESLEELKSGKDDEGNEVVSISKTKDPWGNDYLYEVDSTGRPRASCLGKDGSQGGEGENKDFFEPEEEGS